MSSEDQDLKLEESFPKLRPGVYRIKSPKDPRYNCFAFAQGDTNHHWEYTGLGRLGGYFWPNDIEGDRLEDVIEVYKLVGFEICETAELEPDIVKIAIYVDRDLFPTHVARQTRQGTWKSKLGKKGKDIEHDTLEVLEGYDKDEYGDVVRFMKRRRYEWEDTDD